MYLDGVSLDQIIMAIAFIAVLIVLQILIKKNKSSIRGKFSSAKRVEIVETTRLGPNEKIQIINVDRKDYLYFHCKGSQPVIIPVESSNQSNSSTKTQKTTIKAPELPSRNSVLTKQQAMSENSPIKKSNNKVMRAISDARKLNPKVSFE